MTIQHARLSAQASHCLAHEILCLLAYRKARRPIPAPPRSQTLWKVDVPAQLISNSVPFHEREARLISPSEAILRPSEICIKPFVRHWCFPLLSVVP